MTSGDQTGQPGRDRAAARARHPASQHRRLRLVTGSGRPAQTAPEPASAAPDTTVQETTMTTPIPATDDYRDQLRALLAQAGELGPALDEIARDDRRRLADVTRQLRA